MVKLILGPPGTGKTTTLLNLIHDYLSKGVNPDKIGFISFTKKSVTEAIDRASVKFDQPKDWFQYFRTIHSLSFRQLTMSPTQVMQRNNYRELGDIIGTRMTGIHRQDQAVYEMPIGDQMVFIESLARLMCKNLKEMWSELNSDISWEQLDYFRKSLVKFKKSSLLFDFTDMLVKYNEEGYKPELEVLFVDEAQDLCRLQWDIVNQMIEYSQDTYIAGDDDQAIFRWSGADVDYFLSLADKYNTRILHQSYRLPKKIYEFSNEIVKQIEKRNNKKFNPTLDIGTINYINDIEDVNMDKGQWLILVRNGYMIKDLEERMRIHGYPYETTYYSIQNDEAIKAAITWEKLRKNGKVLASEVSLMLNFMTKKHLGSKKLLRYGKQDTLSIKQLIDMNIFSPSLIDTIWHEALNNIPAEDREYYIAVRRRDEKLTTKPRIKISTIHGAKGGEADNVILHTDMSAKTYNNMMNNYDDELRVFYVGATRAKKNLYVVQPRTNNYFSI